ncbi:MAG: hypothetical protein RBU45_06675 [Myxococcota bacterium]|jgi:CheY-like chemotaxis protein|nr:hypothetical protein [Myxococcota bacterium]
MPESVILIADPQREQRDRLALSLMTTGLAARVLPSENGRRLITEYARALRREDSVVAIVLEVSLPIVGGKTASIAMRCLEQAFEQPPAPILFHSDKPEDANLQRVMAYVKRSRFLPRGEALQIAEVVQALQEMLR